MPLYVDWPHTHPVVSRPTQGATGATSISLLTIQRLLDLISVNFLFAHLYNQARSVRGLCLSGSRAAQNVV